MLLSMKNRIFIPLLLVLSLVLAACSSPNTPAPPEMDVTGSWAGSATVPMLNQTFPVWLELEQTGAHVTGELEVADGQGGQDRYDAGPLSGSVEADRLSLDLGFHAGIVEGDGRFSGTVSGAEYSGSGRISLKSSQGSLPVTFKVWKQ